MEKEKYDDLDRMDGRSIYYLPDHLLMDTGDWLTRIRDLRALVATSKRFQALFEQKLYKLDTQGGDRWSFALHWAVNRSDISVVGKVMKFGCNLNCFTCFNKKRPEEKMTALVHAMHLKNLSITTLLIGAGANVDIALTPSDRPIFLALKNNWHGIFKLLHSFGNANLRVLNKKNRGPLTVAVRQNDMETVKYLLSAPVLVEEETHTTASNPLYEAMMCGNFSIFSTLLLSGRFSPNTLCQDGKTLLRHAYDGKEIGFFSSLLHDKRTDLDFGEDLNSEILLHAMRDQNRVVVQLLLAHPKLTDPPYNFFAEACWLQENLIAWEAVNVFNVDKETATEWRKCANAAQYFTLADFITHKFGLDPALDCDVDI